MRGFFPKGYQEQILALMKEHGSITILLPSQQRKKELEENLRQCGIDRIELVSTEDICPCDEQQTIVYLLAWLRARQPSIPFNIGYK
ncbi:MAG: hypothetical protein LBG20_03375, partial [Holosporaceae bacterium]|nr:hypothetical protein [Holosporaceae bacterium]